MTGSHPNHPAGSCDRCATDPGIRGIADPDWEERYPCRQAGHFDCADWEGGPCTAEAAARQMAAEAEQVRWDEANRTGRRERDDGTVEVSQQPCPYRVGQRACTAGPLGHRGPHEWPKVQR